MRRHLYRLLAILMATAAALAALEVASRIGRQPGYRGTRVPGEQLSLRFDPDYRDRTYRLEKEPGTFRILSVGDSYAWGYGVRPEDAYPDRLARQLRRLEPDRSFEVINWSRPGWNSWEEWLSLRDSEIDWKADLLLIGFVLNDAEPTSMSERGPLHRGAARRGPGTWLSRELYRVSRLYARLFEAAENLRQRRAVDAFYRGLYEGESWEQAQEALRKIRRRVRHRDGSMALVVFPVFDPRLAHDYPYADLHGIVADAGRSLRIPTLDLLPAYAGMDPRRLAVEPFSDPHPNELAHRIAAEAIAAFLQKESLLEAP
ncbi:MAG: GDSL-type esterase/lipase family protein [Thermoanaerobaculia bacterium]|nr:GDSL-type esterase/lipase family protein [Thermoanaerobaculia bacterium]